MNSDEHSEIFFFWGGLSLNAEYCVVCKAVIVIDIQFC